jgi:uncharacterized protein
VKPRHENSAFPFCSARCKTIDLGKWVSEEYRIAGGEASEEEDEEHIADGHEDMRH